MFPKHQRKSGEVEVVTSQLDKSVDLASFYISGYSLGRTNITKVHQILQLAVIGYGYKNQVNAHFHNPLPRQTLGTSECWIVMRGKIKVNLYDTDNSPVCSRYLQKGDMAIFYSGGHSLEVFSRKAQIYELKNGPYEGDLLDKKQI